MSEAKHKSTNGKEVFALPRNDAGYQRSSLCLLGRAIICMSVRSQQGQLRRIASAEVDHTLLLTSARNPRQDLDAVALT